MRELLYNWSSEALDVLVPKKRGEGFLMVPYGHHHDRGLSSIEDEARCLLTGLDGYLNFYTGLEITCYPEKRAEFASRIMPLLEKHYNCSSREIEKDEFWEKCPAK